MLYAIISDLHANLEALERVLADAREAGAGRVVCLGDLVGYGPLPHETLARLRALSPPPLALAGNHDDAVSGRCDAADFIDLAGDAARRHRETLSAEELEYLARLPYSVRVGEALAVHGSPADPKTFPYVDSETSAAEAFAATDVRLVFVGHTHQPEFYLTGASGRIYRVPPQDFTLEEGKRYLVNPGSVGYPREKDGRCLSSYVLYDDEDQTIRYRFLPFSVASVMQRGEERRNPHARTFLLALAAALLTLFAGFVFFARLRPRDAAPVLPATPGLPLLTNATVSLPSGIRSITPNLEIENGPVLLELVFRDENALRIGGWSQTVKVSNKIPRKVPEGATEASVTVRNPNPGNFPRITKFAPTLK